MLAHVACFVKLADRNILKAEVMLPEWVEGQQADFIQRLLHKDPRKRLGSGGRGLKEVKSHPWFKRLNWKALSHKQIESPVLPHIESPSDASNFDSYDITE